MSPRCQRLRTTELIKMQQVQKRSVWLGKGRGTNLSSLPGTVPILALKILDPRSSLRPGQTGMVGHLAKRERFPLLQTKDNYGRKRRARRGSFKMEDRF